MSTTNEKMLFEAISTGDEAAFKQLFVLYKNKLSGLAISLTKSPFLGEELLQEVFTSLWVSRRVLADVQDPAAYIYQVTYRKLRLILQKEKHQHLILEGLKQQTEILANANDTEVQLLLSETKSVLAEAIGQLSDQKKRIYQLAKVDGLSYKEIGAELGISPNTVRNHLVEAIKSVKKYFAQMGFGSMLPILILLIER